MDPIGLIGVGLLGSAIAARLKAAKYTIVGYDLIPERRLGATSAQQVARECRTIILCLPTSDVAAQVIRELQPSRSTIIIDCTTGEPQTMAAMGVSSPRMASTTWMPPSSAPAASSAAAAQW